MAFDAVTTLIKIVEKDLVEPKLLWIFDVGGMKVSLLEMIELLSAKLCFLQAFLEECETRMNHGDICTKTPYEAIRDKVARRYGNYKIESKLTQVYLAANLGESVLVACELHRTLKQVVRDIEEAEEWILLLKKKTTLGPKKENITVWDTYQNALEPENEVIVGFEIDIEMIINRLTFLYSMSSVFTSLRSTDIDKFLKLDENPLAKVKLEVIPLVGEGGIGKTTLAKSVYGHPITIASFDIRAWV